jgi:membrane protease YdiL (CAAX protease family)
MIMRPAERPTRTVAAYVVLAYAVAWAWWIPIAVAGRVVRVGGWPTHVPGLMAPALAAFVVTAGTSGRIGVVHLWRRVRRWRIGAWWWVALSPLAMIAVTVAVEGMIGQRLPAVADFGRINGFPVAAGLAGTLLLLIVTTLGEETGWRGFLQPHLQIRLRPRLAMLVVALVWASWHAPLFVIVSTYRGFTAVTVVGFVFGLACGAIVLGWLYNKTGSVLAVAVWHAAYNLGSATAAAHGAVAATVTTLVIVQAVTLFIADFVTHGRVLAPRRTPDARPAMEPACSGVN